MRTRGTARASLPSGLQGCVLSTRTQPRPPLPSQEPWTWGLPHLARGGPGVQTQFSLRPRVGWRLTWRSPCRRCRGAEGMRVREGGLCLMVRGRVRPDPERDREDGELRQNPALVAMQRWVCAEGGVRSPSGVHGATQYRSHCCASFAPQRPCRGDFISPGLLMRKLALREGR